MVVVDALLSLFRLPVFEHCRLLGQVAGDRKDPVAGSVDHGVVGGQAVGWGEAARVAVLGDDSPVGVHGELGLVHDVHRL